MQFWSQLESARVLMLDCAFQALRVKIVSSGPVKDAVFKGFEQAARGPSGFVKLRPRKTPRTP
eukprot:4436247-Amphidinium_carterae.1